MFNLSVIFVVNLMNIYYTDCFKCNTNCLCVKCTGCGVCCASCSDALAWCSNENYIVLKEELMDATGKNTVGEISQLIRIDCLCCTTVRTPIRYSVKMNDPSNNSAALVSLLPMFYRGMPAPCQCCTVHQQHHLLAWT